MEKNASANANANANATPETSPDQRHDEERSPMVGSPPPPARNNDDTNVVVAPTVIELSSSSDTPPVAAKAPESRGETGVDVVGTSYEQSGGGWELGEGAGKKRGRGEGGEQQQVKAAKKKGELTEVPKGEPKCATCNKVFKSWKALFGHLRSHPERTYRGALPPPTAAELDMRRCHHHHHQQLASTLLTLAQEVASRRGGLDIDLNQPSAADQDRPSPENRGGVAFDLNVEPPPESDDED